MFQVYRGGDVVNSLGLENKDCMSCQDCRAGYRFCLVHFIRSLTAVMLSWTHQMHQSPRFQLTFVALETMVDEVGLCTLLHWTMLRILRPRIKYMGVATQ